MERWEGRVAIVTGSSSGIGKGISKVLVEHGMTVVGCARRKEKLEELASELKEKKGRFISYECDIAKDDQVKNMFDFINKELGGVDVCVNNAGDNTGNTLLTGKPDIWRKMMNVNLIALCYCSQLAVSSMKNKGVDDGHIINISSIMGHKVFQLGGHFYSGTKFAVQAVTEGLRSELKQIKSKIRVTTISPGYVETDFVRNISLFKSALEKETLIPMTTDDVAESVLHILTLPSRVEVNDIIVTPTVDSILYGGN